MDRIALQVEGIEHMQDLLTIGPQFILVAMTLKLSSGRARRHAIGQLEVRLKRSQPRLRCVLAECEGPISSKTKAHAVNQAAVHWTLTDGAL